MQLAWLLRRWWEEAGSVAGGTRPTQQALAARLGVDQTTLSRYLNPKHASTAPPRVVEALHAQLRAPEAELERARALCRAAQEENGRQRIAGSGPESAARPDAENRTDAPSGADADADAAAGTEAVPGTDGRDASGGRSRFRRALPGLVVTAVVLSFAAGMVVHERLAPDGRATTAGAAGAVRAGKAPYEWPLLRMKKEDQYTRGRALQNLLNAWGYKVRADGFFGEDTHDAVMDFQRKRHLAPDGKVGRDTWPELVRPVGPGSEGFEVLAVQQLLDNVGQGGTVVSGKFTAVTAEDLRFFQRTHHLPATGRADTETWMALLVHQLPPVAAPAYQRSMSPVLPSTSA
ncbi:peptidoglycan-binding protein [Streptomyces griseicoloratus]|uniref:peptidoglycan-binding protein n=1 Tax=Streptomyces griseicoloratus TaxID=2752516 RepID=UPI0028122D03|nr:peptidoglycan-binding protein [Streptomyces griseicoloratus]